MPRLAGILGELGIMAEPTEKSGTVTAEKMDRVDRRRLIADIAEDMAKRAVKGEHDDPIIIDMARYWLDKNDILDVLEYSWCAAFVYHCVIKAGYMPPIRHPNTH